MGRIRVLGWGSLVLHFVSLRLQAESFGRLTKFVARVKNKPRKNNLTPEIVI